jgi:hypothetical protein
VFYRRFGEGLLDPIQRVQDDLLGNTFVVLADEKQMINGKNIIQGIDKILCVSII